MSDPASVELQLALRELLLADAGVIASFSPAAPAIYDKVPAAVMQAFTNGSGPTYATIGEGQESYSLAGDEDEEGDSLQSEQTEHALSLHVWSQTVGLLEAKRIAAAMRSAMTFAVRAKTIALPSNVLTLLDPHTVRYDRTTDGFTSHAWVIMRALTFPNS